MGTFSIRFRPQSFDEVIGNNHVIDALKNQIKCGRLPRAVLFSGLPGVGKTTLARILASALGCLEVKELNAAETNGVADARTLAAESAFSPLSGKYKAVILDEAQQLTTEAQNVLLKPLEDANSSTFWIFCTTAPDRLIRPLKDRCLSFQLEPLSSADRAALVHRVLLQVGSKSLSELEIVRGLDRFYVTTPREVLMCLERIYAGMPLDAAISGRSDQEASYIEVARAVVSGSWSKASELLRDFTHADRQGIRMTVAGYLRSMLLKSGGDKGDTIMKALQRFETASPPEAALDWSLLVGQLYAITCIMGGVRL